MTRIPGEFLFVAECCRWPPPGDDALAARWAGEPLDWARVARIARRHRVQGLVWNRLRSSGMAVPEEPARALRSAAGRIARDNLHAVRECLRLKAAFDAAGVPILFIKGVTLAMLAYGTLALKAGWDIDVLVGEDRVDAAAAILTASGYRCILPQSPDLSRLREWHRVAKESVWQHAATRTVVELHTRLVDNSMLLRPITLEDSHSVPVGDGLSLPTLAPDALFAYLCVHGAWSAWYRLKWLADVAALVAHIPSSAAERRRLRSSCAAACSASRCPTHCAATWRKARSRGSWHPLRFE
jgi:hypothetical protein